MGQERTPKENSDKETQFRMQQETLGSKGDFGDVQAIGNHAVASWRRSVGGIARVVK